MKSEGLIGLPDFQGVPVLVAGDVMLDRYWHGDTGRISPEAPVPVVRVNDSSERPGGAGNVALGLAALGAAVTLIGVTGDDRAGHALRSGLEASGITPRLLTDPKRSTVTKLRVMSRNQQLIRLDSEDPADAVGAYDEDAFLADFTRILPSVRAVVLSDYGKGALTRIPAMVQAAGKAGVPVLADPKGRDWEKYRGVDVLTPNLAELNAMVEPCPDLQSLVARGEAIRSELNLGGLLVTRSEHGMLLLRGGCEPLALPARAREVFDVTGAGDTVISTLAAAVAAGGDMADGARLANMAAGLAVARSGTASITSEELQDELHAEHHAQLTSGMVSQPELLKLLASCRSRGKSIVMTNGCFDLLHAGHVEYLQKARALGDVLVVAVNDDASVRRLKGSGRPLNPAEQRMRVLAALESVDYVTPFSSDTPAELIARVCPDKLVKGGDYHPNEVAGQESVRAAGGEVVVLDYLGGYSTTGLIERIRES